MLKRYNVWMELRFAALTSSDLSGSDEVQYEVREQKWNMDDKNKLVI